MDRASPGPRGSCSPSAPTATTERLTTCTQRSEPCDFLQVAPSVEPRPGRGGAGRPSAATRRPPPSTSSTSGARSRPSSRLPAGCRRRTGARTTASSIYSTGDVEDLRSPFDPTATTSAPHRHPRRSASAIPVARLRPERRGLRGPRPRPRARARSSSSISGRTTPPRPSPRVAPAPRCCEGTPYIVGSDSTPAFSPGRAVRRLPPAHRDRQRRARAPGTSSPPTSNATDDVPTVVAVGGGRLPGRPGLGPGRPDRLRGDRHDDRASPEPRRHPARRDRPPGPPLRGRRLPDGRAPLDAVASTRLDARLRLRGPGVRTRLATHDGRPCASRGSCARRVRPRGEGQGGGSIGMVEDSQVAAIDSCGAVVAMELGARRPCSGARLSVA